MPQQLFIPVPGTIIALAEDWTFKLFFERRNHTLLQALCPNPVPPMPAHYQPKSYEARYHGNYWGDRVRDHEGSPLLRWMEAVGEKELPDADWTYCFMDTHRQPYLLATMPAGHQLKFERIHIRAKPKAYNTVTFKTTRNGPDPRFHSIRFWVELQDANRIICDETGERSCLEFGP